MARIARPWFSTEKNCWMVYFDGKKHRLADGKRNKKAATDKWKQLQLLALSNPHPDAPDQTVASVIEAYISSAEKRLAEATLTLRTVYLQSFAEHCGWRRIVEAKPLHMEQWIDAHPEWASDWTKATALRSVQVAFNWAADKKVIRENPFKGVSHREGEPRRDMTPTEFQAILRATGSGQRKKLTPGARFRQILIFLWYTGCRPKEASGLTWANINFDTAMIILKQHKTSRTQRVPKPRIIPLHPVVVKLLRSIQARDEGELVFLTHRKTPWDKNSLGLRIRRARDRAGVPNDVKLYGTRHAFGTRAVMNSVNLPTLAALLGHSSTRMSEHYLHLAGQHQHLADAMLATNVRRRGA